MAVATPTMLPVPTRPDRAMAKAWNEEMPARRDRMGATLPSTVFFLSLPALPKSRRNISPKRRTCTKRVRNEKYSPAIRHSPTNAGLHTQLLTVTTASANQLPVVSIV